MLFRSDDPFLWLENIHGADALAWVKAQNDVSATALKADPRYQRDYDALLAMLDADDRIPLPELIGSTVFNVWQDAQHVHGIWRRTSLSSYRTSNPQWETLLDLDALPAEPGKSWVFSSANCAKALDRCLVSLSPGGGDAVDRKSTRLNSSHSQQSRMPSSA